MTKKFKPVKLDKETHDIIQTLSREIEAAQNFKVSMGETIKRNFNRPNTREVLIEDARVKRRLRR